MDKADIAALLALGAAFFIAIGDVIHQRSAHEVTDEPVSHVDLFLRLLRDGRWWLGSVVAAVGFALQAAALGLGSVLLVQAAAGDVAAVRAADQRAAVAPAGDPLGMDMGGAARRGGRGDRDRRQSDRRALPGVVRDVDGGDRRARARAGAVRGGRADVVRPRQRGAAGVVSGALWGVFAVLTKGVVDRLDDGLWALLRTPELYVWALVAIAGTAWQQSSFRAGALTASLPTMTVAEPVVGSVLGIVVLGETLRPGDAGWLTLIVAVAVMVVATAALARGEAAGATEQPV